MDTDYKTKPSQRSRDHTIKMSFQSTSTRKYQYVVDVECSGENCKATQAHGTNTWRSVVEELKRLYSKGGWFNMSRNTALFYDDHWTYQRLVLPSHRTTHDNEPIEPILLTYDTQTKRLTTECVNEQTFHGVLVPLTDQRRRGALRAAFLRELKQEKQWMVIKTSHSYELRLMLASDEESSDAESVMSQSPMVDDFEIIAWTS